MDFNNTEIVTNSQKEKNVNRVFDMKGKKFRYLDLGAQALNS